MSLQNHQTPLSIAQRLGYISVVDTLKDITEITETVPTTDEKYKVVSPEIMQETFLSDSEDEGGKRSIDMCEGYFSGILVFAYILEKQELLFVSFLT